jgi:hypothetical protein
MSERERQDHAEELAAHAAMTPPDTEPAPNDLLPVAELADADVAHAADTPPGVEPERDAEIPPPPDEVQMHTTHQPDVFESPDTVTDGDFIRQAEELFPVLWVAMLISACYIAVYFALQKVPNSNYEDFLPGPHWF